MANWFTRLFWDDATVTQAAVISAAVAPETPAQSITEKRTYYLNQPFPFFPTSPAGVAVNDETVMGLPPAFAAIRYIAEGVAMLDRKVRKRNGELAENHDLQLFFNGKPHPYYTWFDFTAALITNACMGNGYALIYRDEFTMRPYALEHIPSNMCYPEYGVNGELLYAINGYLNGRVISRRVPYTDIIHIKGVTLNAMEGLPMTLVHRPTFAAGLASREYSEAIFGNRATPSIAVKHKQPLDADERTALKENIIQEYGGSVNAGKPFILDEDMEIEYLQWTPNDVALIDFNDLTVRDCCRIWKVPADMMALDQKGTYGAKKSHSQDFLMHCLGPWREKFEEAINSQLFYTNEFATRKYYFEYDVSMYLEMDKETEANVRKTDAERLAVLVASSMMTPNEARKELGLEPKPDGDQLFGNINLLPLDQLVEVALAKYLSSEGEKGRNAANAHPQQQNSSDNVEPAQPGR
ncbi:MAG: phage portal protein [Bacteroidetes bacterium]|nr:phage portal protein [Bacteroidota bacterium]